MSAAQSVSVAVVFVWLGMVLAISFLEAPLKFQAPGVSVQIGLSIGRLVFRALNTCEAVLAVMVGLAFVLQPPSTTAMAAFAVVVAAFVLQVLAVRPVLTRRSDAVLAGAGGSRSRGHYAYVALEAAKVVALVLTGIALLSA